MCRDGMVTLAMAAVLLLAGCTGRHRSEDNVLATEPMATAVAGVFVVGVVTIAFAVEAASISRDRFVYEYPNGPLLADGSPAHFWIQHNTKAYDVDENVNDAQRFSFMNATTGERWRMAWIMRKSAQSKRRLGLTGVLERQGETFTNWVISLDPVVVVTTRDETAPSDGTLLRWMHDESFVSAETDPYVLVHTLASDRLLLHSGLIASHILNSARPIRWYSPGRSIAPRVIEDDGGDAIEIDTGKEAFTLTRLDGRWVAQRVVIDDPAHER